jgi:Transport and Golgi organisation 2
MCTLTFLPGKSGYMVGMNRDEQISRPEASPPVLIETGSGPALYPRDLQDGTWIGANGCGITFALLNWNDVDRLSPKGSSRGRVIPALLKSTSLHHAHATLRHLEVQGLLPFNLIAFFPAEERISQWSWNQRSLDHRYFSWHARQWFSSSLSDAQAGKCRALAYTHARGEADYGTMPWLRRLHASHDPRQPPLSTCVHRPDVKTVSYTELICSPDTVLCNYLEGNPCSSERPIRSLSLPRF